MHHSLMRLALSIAPTVRKSEKSALDNQRAAKKKKQDLLREKKMIAVQHEYATALTYLDVAHSPSFWKTKKDANKEFTRLGSKTAKLQAVKFQIRICVIGFGWKDLHHPWSEGGIIFFARTTSETFM